MNAILPLVPHGANKISENLSVINENGSWTYCHGIFPVFKHDQNDTKMFRIITSSLISNGSCRNIDIINTFNVSKSSVERNVKKYQEHGSAGFLASPKTRGTSTVLTSEVIKETEELLGDGFTATEVADKLNINKSTLSKGILQGRVKKTCTTLTLRDTKPCVGTNKSERSQIDAQKADEMGVACTRAGERLAAAVGVLSLAQSKFEPTYDVKNGGVLAALPALSLNGLYHEIENVFEEFTGYYSVIQILTLVAFMSLSRIKSIEQLGEQPPGELGKLLGLDRIPGVKCLREKLSKLSQNQRGSQWGELLSKKWMNDNSDLSGVLYIDGHVRLYGGKEKIPKQFVSRERLCLRGMMDFWVNDMLGQPFFVIRQDINPGMIEVLLSEIVPRLLKEVPNQPTQEQLQKDKHLHRFILVFDREGYSPELFRLLWADNRIACMTYHKYPDEDWNEQEFEKQTLKLVSGENVTMKLAERGSFIGTKKKRVWVKEVRKLTESGHQTSIISTGYSLDLMRIAVLMFARWCQENFFNYMMRHYAIDLLGDYNKKELSDSDQVVSSKWRVLEKQKNSLAAKLKTRKSRFYDFTLNPMAQSDSKKYRDWQEHKTELAEEIEILSSKLGSIKEKQAKIEKHMLVSELPENEQFKAIDSNKKDLVDVIKMISYRAETAMANLISNESETLSAARSLLQTLFVTDADLLPNYETKILNVHFHNLSTRSLDLQLDKLLIHLNDSKMKYPGSEMTLHYSRVGGGEEKVKKDSC